MRYQASPAAQRRLAKLGYTRLRTAERAVQEKLRVCQIWCTRILMDHADDLAGAWRTERYLPPEVIEAWPRTRKEGVLSIKAADLKRHVSVPAIRELLEVNARTKLLNSFGEELAAKVSATSGRLHPTYNIAGTKTGRFSSSNPNIEQIPKHKAKGMRRCFVAAPGMSLVIADYAAMELRAAAAISEDNAMNADLANGIDLHRRQAAEMLDSRRL